MKNIVLLFLLLICLNSFSQSSKIVYVYDRETPISFAHISIEGELKLISGANGEFIINLNNLIKEEITISHIAYHNKTLNVNKIKDTIYLMPKSFELDEIVVSSINIRALLENAFQKVKYQKNLNYLSARLIAINDSLVYYTEKQFKYIKHENRNLKRKLFHTISFKSSESDTSRVNFPFISTLLKNPYETYQKKEALNRLIKNIVIDKIFTNTIKLKSITDSTTTYLFIDKKSKRLLRLEKKINLKNKQSNPYVDGGINLSYNFNTDNSKVFIKSFKYEHLLYAKTKNGFAKIKMEIFDINIPNIKYVNSFNFKTLRKLKEYKQNQKVIDAGLYRYFEKSELSKDKPKRDSISVSYFMFRNKSFDKLKFNKSSLNLNLPKPYYMAIYNKNAMMYDYYPSKFKINFDLNSVDVNQNFNYPKRDSFNPYGTRHDPKATFLMGITNLIFEKLFE